MLSHLSNSVKSKGSISFWSSLISATCTTMLLSLHVHLQLYFVSKTFSRLALCFTELVEFGEVIRNRVLLDDDSQTMVIPSPERPLDINGWLVSWKIYVNTTGTVNLLVMSKIYCISII